MLSKLTGAPAPANHREPFLEAGVALITFAALIPKGCGAMILLNGGKVVPTAGAVLAKATRRGNRCNDVAGGSTVEPALSKEGSAGSGAG